MKKLINWLTNNPWGMALSLSIFSMAVGQGMCYFLLNQPISETWAGGLIWGSVAYFMLCALFGLCGLFEEQENEYEVGYVKQNELKPGDELYVRRRK